MKTIGYFVSALASAAALASVLGFLLWSTSSFAQEEWGPGTAERRAMVGSRTEPSTSDPFVKQRQRGIIVVKIVTLDGHVIERTLESLSYDGVNLILRIKEKDLATPEVNQSR